ncbi:MAG: MlaD family protein, partial [Proteobacteria bacterium]|nr:MlaD family protein [Pseudomonadota bacterium]
MNNRLLELKVGIFSIVSIVVFIYVLYLINAQFFDKSQKVMYRTLTDNAQGIVNLTTVRTNGVTVGQVVKVQLVGDKTEISFAISANLRIPEGSGIVFRSRGLIGETYLEIIRAPDSQVLIPENGIIPMKTDSVDVSEMIEVVGMIARDVKEITGSISEILGDNKVTQDLKSILSDAHTVTQDAKELISTMKTQMKEVMEHSVVISENFQLITEEFSSERIGTTVSKVSDILDDIDITVGDAKGVIAKVKEG